MKAKIIYYITGSLLWLLLIYLLIEVSIVHFSTPKVTQAVNLVSTPKIPTYPNQYELEIMTSEYRLENKLNALKHDEQLCKWADIRKEEIKTDFSHDSFERKYSANQPVNGYWRTGENISMDYPDSMSTFNGWKASPTHNANMLKPQYTSICVRCSESYCVQLFGAK